MISRMGELLLEEEERCEVVEVIVEWKGFFS